MQVDIDKQEILRSCLEIAWVAETSSDPENWTVENPAYGQCAVTALVVQDLFGGELRRGMVGDVSHYWNSWDDGFEVDHTIHQFDRYKNPEDFGKDSDLPRLLGSEVRDREYVLSFPDTKKRYLLLKQQLAAIPTYRLLTSL